MKRFAACLLPLLLLIGLTACSVELTSPPVDTPAPPEAAVPDEGTPEETPEAPEDETPDVPNEAPEDGTPDLDGLTSAPSFADYPEIVYPTADALDNLPEDGTYTSKDDVALYIYGYGHLPDNFITKKEARDLGWSGGGLDPYAPGMCIGGDRFGNYEGILPEVEDRTYYECDIDTLHASSRGAKRLVFCWGDDGGDGRQVYYTEDHYETFEMVYGDDAPGDWD